MPQEREMPSIFTTLSEWSGPMAARLGKISFPFPVSHSSDSIPSPEKALFNVRSYFIALYIASVLFPFSSTGSHSSNSIPSPEKALFNIHSYFIALYVASVLFPFSSTGSHSSNSIPSPEKALFNIHSYFIALYVASVLFPFSSTGDQAHQPEAVRHPSWIHRHGTDRGHTHCHCCQDAAHW